jgi:hypothetical protein
MTSAINALTVMKSLPLPALVAAAAALIALPFHFPAGATLLLAACLGAIIHTDYNLRARRIKLPRRTQPVSPAHPHFRRFAAAREPHRLAA